MPRSFPRYLLRCALAFAASQSIYELSCIHASYVYAFYDRIEGLSIPRVAHVQHELIPVLVDQRDRAARRGIREALRSARTADADRLLAFALRQRPAAVDGGVDFALASITLHRFVPLLSNVQNTQVYIPIL